ncbi:hypothetical protein I5535_12210 [Rhodobacteraceae bacterium F11138]|nr:hypothetical protein [Rhodobacteraceae bacterium F11138]
MIELDTLACLVTAHDDQGQEITFYAMTPDPSTGWHVEMRMREGLLRFVRDKHPEWWPRDRIASSAGATAGSVDDAGQERPPDAVGLQTACGVAGWYLRRAQHGPRRNHTERSISR